MSAVIVRNSDAVALWGGADVAPEVVNIVQSRAKCHVAADGGADHLLAAGLAPAAVVGDLDSISSAARGAFADRLHLGTDQNTTDFQKVMAAVDAPLVIAAGFLGGRLDHTQAVLHAMVRGNLRHVILVSRDDVCFLAQHSVTRLTLPIGTRVALLPSSARVDTQGLRWDIKDAAMAHDGLISTSNETVAEDVTIHAMGHVFITLPLTALDAAIAAVRVG